MGTTLPTQVLFLLGLQTLLRLGLWVHAGAFEEGPLAQWALGYSAEAQL